MDSCIPEKDTIYWDPSVAVLSSCCLSVPVKGNPFDKHLLDSGVGVCSRCEQVIDFYCIPQILDYIEEGEDIGWFGPNK